MPDVDFTSDSGTATTEQQEPLTRLPFPPLYKSHILHCSYHYWHPRYRTVTPKARLIPLSQPFLDYLRADGIVLPDENNDDEDVTSTRHTLNTTSLNNHDDDADSGIFSATDNDDSSSEEEAEDPSAAWRDVHLAIKATIAELGGKVVPKLNWSAPKDATWISATNSMECRTPNDIYLLLKSSDFVTHDLEHAFDDTEEDLDSTIPMDGEDKGEGEFKSQSNGNSSESNHKAEAEENEADQQTISIPYHLILRKYILLNPSVEFRCFVGNRTLIGICQRDLNHFSFLFKMRHRLRERIQTFFDQKLKNTFPDPDFVFDVYIPPPHERVWLIDVNPWAQRTDPLLFSWLELLTMPLPRPERVQKEEEVVSIPFGKAATARNGGAGHGAGIKDEDDEDSNDDDDDTEGESEEEDDDDEEDEEADEEISLSQLPEFRLVKRDDPEAYSFNTPQYSAHKLPRDVVDASQGGAGSLREFADTWKEVLAKRQADDRRDSSGDEE